MATRLKFARPAAEELRIGGRRGHRNVCLTLNLMVSSDCEPTLARSFVETRVDEPQLLNAARLAANSHNSSGSSGLRDEHMREEERQRRGRGSISVIAAAVVAVIGQTAILLNDFGSGNDSQGNGSAKMITAAEVSRAGAIEIPSEPPEVQPVSLTP